MGRSYSISKPLRNYYQVRNAILVGKENGWIYYTFRTVTLRFIQICLSGVYEKNLLARVAYFYRGLLHGLTGKTGKYL